MQVIKLLIDECISSKITFSKLYVTTNDIQLIVKHIRDIDLFHKPDKDIYTYAIQRQFIVVTINGKDFIKPLSLVNNSGLIWIKEGNLPKIEYLSAIQESINFMIKNEISLHIMIEVNSTNTNDVWKHTAKII